MKAIALISGGLDSTLALRVIQEQGIALIAVNFVSPFCRCSRKGCRNEAKFVSENSGIELKVFSVQDEFLEIVKRPPHGYGSNMNPCIDCRILMFKKAKEFMRQTDASFIVTGEVLGQRPMSQRKFTLKLIEMESGLEGLVLRPLSAKKMSETIPEKNGWVDRGKLLAITGRSRKPQLALAKDLGVDDFPCPAGGCLLTDPNFSKRVKDLLKHNPDFGLNDIELLKLGRHYRLSPTAKLVVGRDSPENAALLALREADDLIFEPAGIKGPVSILRTGEVSQTTLNLAEKVLVYYFSRYNQGELAVEISGNGLNKRQVLGEGISEAEIEKLRI